jgi:hypothetical protein
LFIPEPSKISPNLDIRFEKKPSGNPGTKRNGNVIKGGNMHSHDPAEEVRAFPAPPLPLSRRKRRLKPGGQSAIGVQPAERIA